MMGTEPSLIAPIQGHFSFREAFFSGIYQSEEHYLDGMMMEGRCIAQNVANAQTPGYHPIHVDFGDYFLDRMKAFQRWRTKGQPKAPLEMDDSTLAMNFSFDPMFDVQYGPMVSNGVAIGESTPVPPFQPAIVHSPKAGVDLNREMADLARVQVLYGLYARDVMPGPAQRALNTFGGQ